MAQFAAIYLVARAARTWADVVFDANTAYVSTQPTQPVALVAKLAHEVPVNCAPFGILQLTY